MNGISPIELTLAAGIFFLGASVQGTIGFGFGMICMATLPFFMDFKFAVPLVSVFSLLAHLVMVHGLRKSVIPARFLPMVAGGVVGIPLGVNFLRHADLNVLKLTLGLVIVGYVIWSFWPKNTKIRDPGRGWAVLAGLVGGALGGAMNSSGPPVVIYLTQKPWDKDSVKATLQVFFILMSITQLSLFAMVDILTLEVLQTNLLISPAILLGVWSGIWVSKRVDHQLFRNLVIWTLQLLGAVFVTKGFSGI